MITEWPVKVRAASKLETLRLTFSDSSSRSVQIPRAAVPAGSERNQLKPSSPPPDRRPSVSPEVLRSSRMHCLPRLPRNGMRASPEAVAALLCSLPTYLQTKCPYRDRG